MKVHQYPFGLIVYLNRTWTGIHVTCGIISSLAMLLWFFIPESPRWLAQNGYESEALEGKLNAKDRLILISPNKGHCTV